MRPLRLCLAFALIALSAVPTLAAQRTFVASTGVDTNPCTRVAPCRAFTAALALTDPNGEVIVLDSAGYGATTITQSVAIVAPQGVYAGISVFAGAGIVVNGPSIKVTLQGLTINGQGGTHGIRFEQGASLWVTDTKISGMTGDGVSVQGAFEEVVIARSSIFDCHGGVSVAAPGKASLSRVELARNVTGALVESGGIMSIEDSVIARSIADGAIASAGIGQSAQLTVSRSMVSANGAAGVLATSFGSGAVAHAAVVGSSLTGNGTGAGAAVTAGSSATLTVQANLVTRNGTGILAQGGTVVANGNAITRNSNGIVISGGSVRSAGDNTVDSNGVDLSGGAITPAVVM